MHHLSTLKYSIWVLGPLISSCNLLLCLYICIIRVEFSQSCSYKDNNKCLIGKRRFAKSTRLRLYKLRQPTNIRSSNLSGKAWLWTPYFTSIFHCEASLDDVDLILNWQPYFLVALCVALTSSLYFSPLTQLNINLLFLPIFHVLLPKRVMITFTLCLIQTFLIYLITFFHVSKLCVFENALVVFTHIWFFSLIYKGISIYVKHNKKYKKICLSDYRLLLSKLSAEQTWT